MEIYLAYSQIFVGINAKIRSHGAIRKLIARYGNYTKPLLKGVKEGRVDPILRSLLARNIFERTSEAGQTFLNLINTSSHLLDPSFSDCPINPLKFPLQTQVEIFTKIQKLLEHACHRWSIQWLPKIFVQYKSEEPAAIELNEWIQDARKLIDGLPAHPFYQPLKSFPNRRYRVLKEIRHHAVHRKPTAASEISVMVQCASDFCRLIQQDETASVFKTFLAQFDSRADKFENWRALLMQKWREVCDSQLVIASRDEIVAKFTKADEELQSVMSEEVLEVARHVLDRTLASQRQVEEQKLRMLLRQERLKPVFSLATLDLGKFASRSSTSNEPTSTTRLHQNTCTPSVLPDSRMDVEPVNHSALVEPLHNQGTDKIPLQPTAGTLLNKGPKPVVLDSCSLNHTASPPDAPMRNEERPLSNHIAHQVVPSDSAEGVAQENACLPTTKGYQPQSANIDRESTLAESVRVQVERITINSNASLNASSTSAQIVAAQPPIPTPVKRGRGRPPGKSRPANSTTSATLKRKPGRPPKAKQPDVTPTSATLDVVVPPAKRGPGRPPKKDTVATAATGGLISKFGGVRVTKSQCSSDGTQTNIQRYLLRLR